MARSIGQPALTGSPLAWLALLAAPRAAPTTTDSSRRHEVLAGHRLGVMDQFVADLLRWAKPLAQHSRRHRPVPAPLRPHARRSGDPARRHIPDQAAVQAGEARPRPRGRTKPARELRRRDPVAVGAARPPTRARADDRPADAPGLFETALAHDEPPVGRTTRRVSSSRTGSTCAAGHRVDARIHLRQALETFRDLPAEPLVDRATVGAPRSGETARKRTHPPWSS